MRDLVVTSPFWRIGTGVVGSLVSSGTRLGEGTDCM